LGKAPQSERPGEDNRIDPRWIGVRKTIQYLVLFLFIFLFLLSRQDVPGKNLIGYFLRFDPLLALTAMLSGRTFQVVTAIELVLALILAILAGRAWCGWLCPMGTTLDILTFKKTIPKKVPEELRSIKYSLFLVILISALLGNLTLLIFDPLTILFRTLGISIYPGLNQVITVVETALYPVPFLQDFISWLEGFLRPNVFPLEPRFYEQALLTGVYFAGIIGLNKLASRFWCRFICPLGGFLGLIAKIAIFRREPGETCRDCSLCSRRCPTGTIDPANGYRSDPGECTLCLDCFKNCAGSSIRAHSPFSPAAWKMYDLKRRDLITSTVLSVTGIALFHGQGRLEHPDVRLLRPPGAKEQNILEKCLRCGACIQVCPTSLIQPAGLEMGLERLYTPVLNPEKGYCEFSCNACGRVCPVEAIPALELEEKQIAVIGKAYIDQNRCLAWSDHKTCMVCEEMCPLPTKAIQLTDADVIDPDGTKRAIRVPQVDRNRCIGCGVCEFKCPVIGEAAIRVYAAKQSLFE